MTTNLNRRMWIKSAGMAAAGLSITPNIAVFAAGKKRVYNQYMTHEINSVPMPPAPKLKARLNANENPFGPSEMTRLAIMESVATGNRYGHGDAATLIDMIAQKEGVPKECIMLGPGSTDMLEKIAITHFIDGGNVVSADPSYMSLVKTAQAFGTEWKGIPLAKDWSHDLPAMYDAIDGKTKLIYICNPNNPTGSITDSNNLRAFCEKASEKVPIFVDEAYLEYLHDPNPMIHSMVDLVAKGKNIMVARTFSKINGMAGLRIGYLLATAPVIENLNAMVRGTMGMCVTSLKGAIASIQDKEFHDKTRKLTKEARDFTCESLKVLGFEYVPSHTSFVLFPIAMEGQAFLKKMYEEGIGVRAFNIFGKPYCRVSMGTMEEMEMFVGVLKKVLV